MTRVVALLIAFSARGAAQPSTDAGLEALERDRLEAAAEEAATWIRYLQVSGRVAEAHRCSDCESKNLLVAARRVVRRLHLAHARRGIRIVRRAFLQPRCHRRDRITELVVTTLEYVFGLSPPEDTVYANAIGCGGFPTIDGVVPIIDLSQRTQPMRPFWELRIQSQSATQAEVVLERVGQTSGTTLISVRLVWRDSWWIESEAGLVSEGRP